MSFFNTWVERLQATRLTLEQNTQINDPLNYTKLTGTLDFLLNPALNPRTIDVVQQQNANASEYRSVEITYQPHWGDDAVVEDDSADSCDKTSQRRDNIDTYDVDCYFGTKFTLDEDYIRQTGPSQQGRLDDGFRRAMRQGRESISKQLLSKLSAAGGTNPAQNAAAGAYTIFQAINSDGGADVNNFDIMVNDQEDNFMTGPLAVIGQGGNVRKYFNRLAVGNLNTNAGVDIREVAQQFGALFFKDQSAETTLGDANRLLAVYPGLCQYYDYDFYTSDFQAPSGPNFKIKTTMPDPIYPINWDVIIDYDDGCSSSTKGRTGSWIVRVFKYFDLFTTPTAAFGGSYSDLAGFNGIMGYELTSA